MTESTSDITKPTPAPPPPATPAPAAPEQRLDDLAQIIRAYNQVTENLQRSHESLQSQVERLRAELASADAQLQRSKRLAALGEMAAGIAHEVRNPLAAIQLYARMIGQDVADARAGHDQSPEKLATAADAADKIAQAARGLNAVVGDVLSFARDLKPRTMAVPVSVLFDRVVEAERASLVAGSIHVELHADDELHVLADPDLSHQALLNLVRNAIEAMNERATRERSAGNPWRSVLTLDARREGSQICLAVQDNGSGIADEHVERIFNPFFTTRNTGTGLGLAIVHRIVDAHGGAISVHNDVAGHGGAVFELSLPVAEPAADSASEPTPAAEPSHALASAERGAFV